VVNDRQRRFAEEYIKDLNATQAAIRAGYAEKTAESQGSRLLSHVKVSAYVRKLQAEQSERLAIDADYILTQAIRVYDRCMEEVQPMTVLNGEVIPDENGNVVCKFNAAAALKALELAGKHVNVQAFNEKHSVDHTGAIDSGSISEADKEMVRQVRQHLKESRVTH